MDLQMQRLPISASRFKELITSRAPLQRFNDPSKDCLGLYDPVDRVAYVITRTELSRSLHAESVQKKLSCSVEAGTR